MWNILLPELKTKEAYVCVYNFYLYSIDICIYLCINRYCAVLSHSVVSDSLQLHGLSSARLLCPWGFSRQEYWSGLPCPPPGDLPNPGIEPRSPTLQADSLPPEPSGKPKNTGVGSLSLLQGSSWPRNQTRVACIAGWFITSWATQEAHIYFFINDTVYN